MLLNFVIIKVKDRTKDEQNVEADESMDSSVASPFDSMAAYKAIIEFMEPGENITRTLKRLGGNRTLSASERLKRKKAGLSVDNSGNSEKVTELTELANSVLSRTGNMDIYQYTYQQLSDLVSCGHVTSKLVYFLCLLAVIVFEGQCWWQ